MEERHKIIHYAIKVTGKVQRVFYRATTKEVADQLGVKGWVRNEPDGSVFIKAEGTVEQMNAFIDWCKQGSRFAQVKDVSYEETTAEGFSDFSVKR